MKQDLVILNTHDQTKRYFEEVFAKYSGAIREYIQQLANCSILAEDISQEVFLKLWLKRDFLSQIGDVGCYLYRAAKNEFIDYKRKERIKYRSDTFFKGKTVVSNITEEVIYQKELEAIVQQAIQTLSPHRKKVYVLGKIEGVPLEHIAMTMGIASRTVKEMMRLANKQVRNYVNEQMGTNRIRKYSRNPEAMIKSASVATLEAA